MSSIDKTMRITNPAPVERISRDTQEPKEPLQSQRRQRKNRLQPAASVDLALRCPICRAPGAVPNDDQTPTCRFATIFPGEHKHIEELRALIRQHQNRKVAEFLARQAEQLSHQLQQRAMRTTYG